MIPLEPPDYSRDTLLAYDGDCRMCTGSIRSMQLLGLLEGIATQPAALVTGTDRELLDSYRRSGEIVLLDAQRQNVLTGAAAFRWLLQRRLPRLLGTPLDFAPLFGLMCIGYRFIAAWRRLISPPQTPPDPTFSEPDWVARYRIIGSVVLLALALWLLSMVVGIPSPDPDHSAGLVIGGGLLLLVSSALIPMLARAGRKVDTVATLVGAIVISTFMLAMLVLLKNIFLAEEIALLQPSVLFGVAMMGGFWLLFRCQNWLDGSAEETRSSEIRRPLSAASKRGRIVVLAIIQIACVLWITFLFGIL